jgi:hypothetical protein
MPPATLKRVNLHALRFKILTWFFYIKTIKNTSQKGANNKIRDFSIVTIFLR